MVMMDAIMTTVTVMAVVATVDEILNPFDYQ